MSAEPPQRRPTACGSGRLPAARADPRAGHPGPSAHGRRRSRAKPFAGPLSQRGGGLAAVGRGGSTSGAIQEDEQHGDEVPAPSAPPGRAAARAGPESLDAHLARLGPLPPAGPSDRVVAALEASGLLGRGGAGFPVGRKWRAMAERREGRAVVVANGAEGEPASLKDRVLMAHRPHLVIDGAVLAAEAVGADEIVFYVGEEHDAAVAAMGRAIEERRDEIRPPIRARDGARSATSPARRSAAVHYINDGDARPTTTPPRVSERGVGGRPTLVQNVESLAYAALIARFGDRWYRSAGRLESRGTALITRHRRRPATRASGRSSSGRRSARSPPRPAAATGDPGGRARRLLRDVGAGRRRLGPARSIPP